MSSCFLCNSEKEDDILYGKLMTKNGMFVHYFCLLLSSNLVQNGADDKGFLGFLPKDIKIEAARVQRQKCHYCNKVKANIACCAPKCRINFHLTCGIEKNCLNTFVDTFQSFCNKHIPNVVKQRPKSDELCSICYDNIGKFNPVLTILSPCCQNGWFHKNCLANFAVSAGYFFKCPLCNNNDEFCKKLVNMGVFIPDQDASWELEPNAFAELLERPDTCSAPECNCAGGRKSNIGKNKLIFCQTCGSKAIHKLCLPGRGSAFACDDCISPAASPSAAEESLCSEIEEDANEDEDVDIMEMDEIEEEVEESNLVEAAASPMDSSNDTNDSDVKFRLQNPVVVLKRVEVDWEDWERLNESNTPSPQEKNMKTDCDSDDTMNSPLKGAITGGHYSGDHDESSDEEIIPTIPDESGQPSSSTNITQRSKSVKKILEDWSDCKSDQSAVPSSRKSSTDSMSSAALESSSSKTLPRSPVYERDAHWGAVESPRCFYPSRTRSHSSSSSDESPLQACEPRKKRCRRVLSEDEFTEDKSPRMKIATRRNQLTSDTDCSDHDDIHDELFSQIVDQYLTKKVDGASSSDFSDFEGHAKQEKIKETKEKDKKFKESRIKIKKDDIEPPSIAPSRTFSTHSKPQFRANHSDNIMSPTATTDTNVKIKFNFMSQFRGDKSLSNQNKMKASNLAKSLKKVDLTNQARIETFFKRL